MAIEDAQVTQYLASTTRRTSNFVFRRYFQDVRTQLAAVNEDRLTVTADQLQVYAEERLLARLAQHGPARYWATHIVESDASAQVWTERIVIYPWLRGYVNRQCALLDAGGEVLRIFLIEQGFALTRPELCREMFAAHARLFDAAKHPVTTLVALLPQYELPQREVCCLDSSELFMWERARGGEYTRSAYRHGYYSVAPTDLETELSLWRRRAANAHPVEEFSKLLAAVTPA